MRFSLIITFVSALSLLLGCKPASPTQAVQGRVLRCGIYETPGEPVRVPVQDEPSGFGRHLTQSPVFVKETDRIPATRHVRFGFDFEAIGLPPEAVEFRRVVIHPPMRKLDGSVVTRSEFLSLPATPTNGCLVAAFGFGFDHDYELVPGKWTLEIWRGSQKLIERTFEVYTP